MGNTTSSTNTFISPPTTSFDYSLHEYSTKSALPKQRVSTTLQRVRGPAGRYLTFNGNDQAISLNEEALPADQSSQQWLFTSDHNIIGWQHPVNKSISRVYAPWSSSLKTLYASTTPPSDSIVTFNFIKSPITTTTSLSEAEEVMFVRNNHKYVWSSKPDPNVISLLQLPLTHNELWYRYPVKI